MQARQRRAWRSWLAECFAVESVLQAGMLMCRICCAGSPEEGLEQLLAGAPVNGAGRPQGIAPQRTRWRPWTPEEREEAVREGESALLWYLVWHWRVARGWPHVCTHCCTEDCRSATVPAYSSHCSHIRQCHVRAWHGKARRQFGRLQIGSPHLTLSLAGAATAEEAEDEKQSWGDKFADFLTSTYGKLQSKAGVAVGVPQGEAWRRALSAAARCGASQVRT